jgi:elongation factor Ts
MSLDKIKKLRETTSLGINECRKALAESGGDFDKALIVLKERGISIMEKRKGRQVSQGRIESYIHFSQDMGALVEVNCETDFVARTDAFKKFAKDIAMHIAAANPRYIRKEDVSQNEIPSDENPQDYYKEACLLEQPFVKDNSLTISEYLQQVIAQTGEKVDIKRFARFALGDSNEEE